MTSSTPEPVAIVGMACRLPGASSTPSKLWELLESPRDVLQEFSPSRLNLKRFYHPDGTTHGSTNVTNKSYLLEDDLEAFDANFFGISPLEAESMDPQQRLLLEAVYEAMESAGWPLEQVQGSRTSVHVGAMNADYADIQNRDTETFSKYNATGTARSILSNRVSYVFDLHGPSVTVDTACSSSLVALHQAVQSLQLGDCETAVVGGVNLILDPQMYITESKLSMLSVDSRSRMWDSSANGYARGEGIAALILKPLSHALKNNDPIQAIVRGTGVNSDGRSSGITMPTSKAQADLIRHTYRRAGLDPVADRCHFFECHGTGTKAGDPVEARAIAEAHFSQDSNDSDSLFVGSIKTVVGHTEGCAGLAGVMKAVLAIQHETIPPNMLFQELNPDIRPYYGRLELPTTAAPWPEVAPGAPKRASVNSFGFGGVNAHAIIEEHLPSARVPSANDCENLVGPLTLSAHSGPALLNQVRALRAYLEAHPTLSMSDVCWSLQARRTTHKIRTHFSEGSRDALLTNLDAFIKQHQNMAPADICPPPQMINSKELPGVIGIFTGQGAAWPTMGRGLFAHVTHFRLSIERCDDVLQTLPDGPSWNIRQELEADKSASRLSEAAISQPLCTAIQIALVDVLKAAGVHFHAVIGHSSGEIAALYAAGVLTLAGAMQIAYYRGLHAALAKGTDGQPGGMMATGLTYDSALEFCESEFPGRLVVAASNSPKSVTLSGDLDAISEAKKALEARDIFARPLRVDTAYHSHHMKQCSEAYLKSLEACNIVVNQPNKDCVWSSSVRGDVELLKGDLSSLEGPYWVQNMEQTVLFSQAIESAITHGGPFDVAVEVGPHPALKGPAEETFKAVFGSAPSHLGCLNRSRDDVDALSACLGSYWSILGSGFVDFEGYRRACLGDDNKTPPRMITDLPPYPWDHSQTFWRESRVSQRHRLGQDEFSELLGRRMPDDSAHELRWRNILTLSEVPWLAGHEILGEVLMPGAGYISIALEAGKQLAAGRSIKLLETLNVEVHKPVVVPSQQGRVETIFTARIRKSENDDVIEATFDYSYWPSATASVIQACTGTVVVNLGEPTAEELPSPPAMSNDLLDVPVEDAYNSFASLGLKYEGMFKGMSKISRASNQATARSEWSEPRLAKDFVVHPALLDVVFQSVFVAKAYPAQGTIHSAYLPVKIGRLSVNPRVSVANAADQVAIQTDSFVTSSDAQTIVGDMHVCNDDLASFLQVEGLTLQVPGEPLESEDVGIFSTTVWKPDTSLQLPEPERHLDHDTYQSELARAIDRVSFFYMRKVLIELEGFPRSECLEHHQRMIEQFEIVLDQAQHDHHPILKKSWLTDDEDAVDMILQKFPDQIDLQLAQAIGLNLAAVVRGETQLLEVMLKDNMLSRWYLEGCGFVTINHEIEQLLQKITHKYPRAKYLEIGAGTGGTTKGILEAIGDAYETYTFTDISTGFFEKAKERLDAHEKRITFKALDIEKSAAEQRYEEEAYDVIVAVNVLHATKDFHNTLRHVRSLLKPGGYLVLGEITNVNVLRMSFMMGGLPGWWLSDSPERRHHPCISIMQWDQVLQETGFSGLDMSFHDLEDEEQHCNSLLVARSTNAAFDRIREPLTALHDLPMDAPLLIIGGTTLLIAKARDEIRKLLPSNWTGFIQTAKSIDSLEPSQVLPGTSVICLQELDNPLFSKTLSGQRWQSLQELLANAQRVLWVVRDHRSSSPESAMFFGIARSLEQELPHLRLQILDIESKQTPSVLARTVLEAFARLAISDSVDSKNILWTNEPEMVISAGQALVPRIVPVKSMNDRYNASRRALTRNYSLHADEAFEIKPGRRGLALVKAQDIVSSINDDELQLKVKYSMPLKTGQNGNLFLCYGTNESSGESALALSTFDRSHLHISRDLVCMTGDAEVLPDMLPLVHAYLVAHTLAEVNATILVHDADQPLVQAIKDTVQVKVFFSTSDSAAPSDFIHIHPKASIRAISQSIPSDIGAFLDCSNRDTPASNVSMCLSSTCSRYSLSGDKDQPILNSLGQEAVLRKAFTSAQDALAANQALVPRVFLQKITDIQTPNSNFLPLVVDWEVAGQISLTVQPWQPTNLFKSDRTYLMIGLTGAMGMSLCQWAIDNGARHIVLTSRSPNVDQSWLDAASRSGANVQIWPMDVSDRSSVQSVISRIRDEMPTLAGICNGAMVLSDKLFLDMDIDDMNKALAPKFKGSQIINEVLGSTPLDFFILLSSCAMLIGNPGQSNYHAANLYMTSLATQRRSQALTASVIHLGYIADVGYVSRQNHGLRERLERLLFRPLTETDIQTAFAEAIVAGTSKDCNEPFDLALGLHPSKEHVPESKRPYYFANPRFSHFNPPLAGDRETVAPTETAKNVKHLVEIAESEEAAIGCVESAFCTKLEAIMQLPSGSVQTQQALMDVGIDSLIAVEIRDWFKKELSVQIPVVKILGGSSIRDLCTSAAKKMLAEILSNQSTTPSVVKTTTDEQGSSEDNASTHSSDTNSNSEDARDALDPTLTPDSASTVSSENREEDQAGLVDPLKTAPASIVATPATEVESYISEHSTPEKKSKKAGTTATTFCPPPSPIVREGPISSAESRIWFLSQNSQDRTSCNLTFQYNVKGSLQIVRLRHSLNTVMMHHDTLRSSFSVRPGDNVVLRGLRSSPRYQFKHLQHGDAADVQHEFEALKATEWNSEEGPMLGLTVVSTSSQEHMIILGYHHILMDAFSLSIFFEDLHSAYKLGSLKQKAASYLDYTVYEQALIEGNFTSHEDLRESFTFWKKELETSVDVLPLLPMAQISKRPSNLSQTGTYISERIDQGQWTKIVNTCRSLGITPFHFFLAAFQVLLTRYANVSETCIGVADANRSNETYADTIGFFMNLLPVRGHVSDNAKFADVARAASRKALTALWHAGIPFDTLLQLSNATRSSGHTPLFQASINYRMGTIDEVPLGDCTMALIDGKDAENPFDISLGVLEFRNGSALVEMICNSDLYDLEGTSLLMKTFLRFLHCFTAEPMAEIDQCELYETTAVQDSLAIGRGPRINFQSRWTSTISERFIDIVESHADMPAITHRETTLTYLELYQRVEEVARSLFEAGCSAGSHVALLCQPSIDFVASMLAILHIGAVYCPLDVSLTEERHRAILKTCRPIALVYHAGTSSQVHRLLSSETLATKPQLVDADHESNNNDQNRMPTLAQSDSPAVLLFTSGSTGKPKGIFLTQGNFLNHIALKAHVLGLRQETVLQQSSFGFDMSIIQTLSGLLNGGRVVIVPSEFRRDPVEIARLLQQQAITMTIATPSEYQMWLRHGAQEGFRHGAKSWRHACLGGEVVTKQLLREFSQLELPDLALTNCYGPSEITAAATFHSLSLHQDGIDSDQSGSIIGKALPNYSISIVDPEGLPLPVGVRGEICIAGAGVALGYCDLPEQTAKKFLPDPNLSAEWPYERLYRTGDQGRLLPDGTVVFMGRLDGEQVKLNGVRIELNEVDGTILAASSNKLSMVVTTLRDGNHLVAHATAAPGVSLDPAQAQKLLVEATVSLPNYMRPSRLVIVDDLPLSSAGKIDRRAVQEMPVPANHAYAADGDHTRQVHKLTLKEGELRILWEKVLSSPGISITSETDFFDAGGNSISLMRLQGSIKESMGVSLTTRDLYQASSLGHMAALIGAQLKQSELESEPEVIDWETETQVPPFVQDALDKASQHTARRSQGDIEVLLTGATTFLGSNIAKALAGLLGTTIRKIHCVAVLPDETKPLPASANVVYYTGSLLSPGLGLTATETGYLRSNVDVIIHAGANGHCLNNYQSLRKPNLHSTHQLLALAAHRSVPLLYISSNRVSLLSGTTASPPVSLAHTSPPTDGSEGYTASKWASEVVLGKVANSTSKSPAIQISRPCAVIGADAPNSDALNAILRYSRLLQMVPVFDQIEGFFDFKDVGEVAKEVVDDALALNSNEDEGDRLRFRHHSGGVKVSMGQLREHMEKLHGVPFSACPLAEWIDKALAAGLDPLISAYLEAMVEKGEVLRFPFMGETA